MLNGEHGLPTQASLEITVSLTVVEVYVVIPHHEGLCGEHPVCDVGNGSQGVGACCALLK